MRYRSVTKTTAATLPPRSEGSRTSLTCTLLPSGTDEEACVGWVWTAVVVWVLLAVPAAVALGRVINRAERREIGTPAPDTPVIPTETHTDRT